MFFFEAEDSIEEAPDEFIDGASLLSDDDNALISDTEIFERVATPEPEATSHPKSLSVSKSDPIDIPFTAHSSIEQESVDDLDPLFNRKPSMFSDKNGSTRLGNLYKKGFSGYGVDNLMMGRFYAGIYYGLISASSRVMEGSEKLSPSSPGNTVYE